MVSFSGKKIKISEGMFILPERGQHRAGNRVLVTAGTKISLWFSLSMGEWEPWVWKTILIGVSMKDRIDLLFPYID